MNDFFIISNRNCQNNPRCLHGIGEKALYSNDDSEKWKEENDWEEAKRDTFVGLKNLGATCYVNSLLQVIKSSYICIN